MFLLSSVAFFILCLTLQFPLYALDLNEKSIWYFLHFLCNSIVVIYSLKDINTCFVYPLESFQLDSFDSTALGCTVGLHAYHIVTTWKTLTLIDWLHHIISNLFMTIIGVYFFKIPVWNCGNFFVCGLPGGIDYLLLFMVKINMVQKKTEKHVNMYLNNWVRLPGILYCVSLIHIVYLMNLIKINPIILILSQFLSVLNAIYFAQRVTLNYGKNQ